MNRIFAPSPVPSQVEIKGNQAKSEICFSVLKLGPTIFSVQRDRPRAIPSRIPATLPITKPDRSRVRLDATASTKLPCVTYLYATCTTFSGGTINLVLAQSKAVKTYHTTSKATGNAAPRQSRSRIFRIRFISFLLSCRVTPALQARFQPAQAQVQQHPDDADHDHADENQIQLHQLTPPYHQVTQ